MKKLSDYRVPLTWLALLAAVLLATGAVATTAKQDTGTPATLASSERHYQVARLVTNLSERSHYSRTRIDNDLSAALLETYLDNLDGNRSFFTQQDIDELQRYRYSLDNALRSGDMEPVFTIFQRYRERAQQSFAHAFELLEQEPDFTHDETYVFDRSELPWPADEDALLELWRKRVKNDMLGLLLADPEKPWQESAATLQKRYERVLKRINSLDSDDVFEGFMNSFARTLDPHSSYLSPRQSEEYRIQMSLSYQGIGASLQLNDELVTVLNVIPGGPAAIDGRLKANDHIIGVAQGDTGEMVDVIGWMLDDVVDMIRGPANTTVRLLIRPGSALPGEAEYELGLIRNKIKLEEQAARSEILDIGQGDESFRIGIISIPSFYQDFDARSRGEANYVSTTRDVERLIRELQGENIDGLVIDLRGNGGGHLSEATALSGLFIDNGPIVQLRDTSGRIEVLEDPVPSKAYEGPLAVLIDRFSASASEIFAAAIQDYRRGLIVGQQTFGKGTVQNLYVLDQYARRTEQQGLGQLTLTIGKYYRVTGGSTQNRGVIPDIELPSPIDTQRVGENSKPRALPWDQISPTRYSPSDFIDQDLPFLNGEQLLRAADDQEYQLLLEDIERLNEVRQQKSVSLNLETRMLEQAERQSERLARENAWRSARGLQAVETLEQADDGEEINDRPDVLLQQTARIMTDLIMHTDGTALNRNARRAD